MDVVAVLKVLCVENILIKVFNSGLGIFVFCDNFICICFFYVFVFNLFGFV